MADKRRNQGNMSVNQAGQKGGQTTAKTHDREFYEDIGHKGGQQSGGNFANDPERASEAGQKGGQVGGQRSSGNFANDPERASQAGQKGGQQSGGNFANDPQKASQAGQKGGKNSTSGR